MNIIEKEVTRWELPSVDIANVFRADRNDSIQLWWTPIHELKAYALNVFSPLGHILWNVNRYHPFGAGAHAYMQVLLAKESTVTTLNEVIRDTGAELRSELSYELLGGFTRHFGDRYEPRDSQLSFLSGHRHISVAVPESCQHTVSRHFHELLRVFGESSTRPCPEDQTIGQIGEEDEKVLSNLLSRNVPTMPEQERHACLALIRSNVDILRPDRPDHFKFTGNTGVGISPLGMVPDYPWLSDFADIVRFRVEMAIRHYSMPGIEKLKRDLASKEWGLLCLADLRDELRGQLSTVLARYPVIETNPFELAKQ